MGVDKIFKCLDTDGDGQLNKVEFKNGYAEFFGKYLSDQEVTQMFDRVDTDKSGIIDYSEFLVAALSQ